MLFEWQEVARDSKNDIGEVLINNKMGTDEMGCQVPVRLRRLSVVECSSSGVCILDELTLFDIFTALTRWQAMKDVQDRVVTRTKT